MKTSTQKSLRHFQNEVVLVCVCICKYLKVNGRVYKLSALKQTFCHRIVYLLYVFDVAWESITMEKYKSFPTQSAKSYFGLFLCDAQQFHCVFVCVCLYEFALLKSLVNYQVENNRGSMVIIVCLDRRNENVFKFINTRCNCMMMAV